MDLTGFFLNEVNSKVSHCDPVPNNLWTNTSPQTRDWAPQF